jgi:hypothetical protein
MPITKGSSEMIKGRLEIRRIVEYESKIWPISARRAIPIAKKPGEIFPAIAQMFDGSNSCWYTKPTRPSPPVRKPDISRKT